MVILWLIMLIIHLTHYHPQPLLGKEGSSITEFAGDIPRLSQEGLGVVELTMRKVS